LPLSLSLSIGTAWLVRWLAELKKLRKCSITAQNNITSDVEIISIDKVNEAYERMLLGDVRYRFVIDMATL